MIDEFPRYRDCCEQCRPARVPVDPTKVEPIDNVGGERALYRCPHGHTWTTNWNYGDTDYRAVA